MNKVTNYIYYIVIGVVSILSIIVFPLIGSQFDVSLSLPTSVIGWLLYVGSALATGLVNIIIFSGFINQAKINISENAMYKEAEQILLDLSIKKPNKQKLPRSPRVYLANQYSKKGITIFVGSMLSCFVFTNAVINYNLVVLLTYIFTIMFGIVFGVIQMKSTEKYWCDEYYRYAHYELKKYEEEK